MGLPPTSSKLSSDANEVTTFKFDFPNFSGTHTGTNLSLGINSVAGGGTGLATLTANSVLLGNGTGTPTFVAPGASGNVLTSNGTTWISSAAGSSGVTTLSAVGSAPNANAATITGTVLNLQPFSATFPGVVGASGGGTVNFLRADGTWTSPSGSSLSLGNVGTSSNAQAATYSAGTLTLQQFNSSFPGVVPASGGGTTNFLRADGTWSPAGTGTVTSVTATSPLASSGGTTPNITLSSAVPVTLGGTGNTSATAYALQAGGTSATSPFQSLTNGTTGQILTSQGSSALPSWQTLTQIASIPGPTVQTFLSGSGTYTTPSNPAPYFIRVRAIGGGGGGAGGGDNGGANNGGNGTSTTFGTSLITCNGGAGGAQYGGIAENGAIGGTASASGLPGVVMQGNNGPSGNGVSNVGPAAGAPGPFGGAGGGGGGGSTTPNGNNAAANSGAGGGGGGSITVSATSSGQPGAAGGFVDVVITSPASSYSYTIGSGGAGGTPGTNGTMGGNGGSGFIQVEEYYVPSTSIGITRSVNNQSTSAVAGSSASTDYVYLMSASSTLTLPTAVGNTNLYTVKNTDGTTISVATTSGQTIDGSSSPITISTQYASIDLISNGSNWDIV